MSKRRSKLMTCVVAVVLLGTACSDAGQPFATAPKSVSSTGVAPQENLLGGVIGGVINTVTSLLVPPVKRTTPLASDVVWTFTAGPAGAVSSNASVGLTIVIPPGALDATQTITVTALAGAPIAYKFEPHIEFDRKVYLTQSLNGTTAGLLSPLNGAHFSTDRLELNSSGLAVVTEIVPALTSLFTRTATFGVGHFSGWILGSGRAADYSDE
jgi:hypothetical protein